MEYTKHSEAPDVFHFWTGVSMIAGALRRRVWIEERIFQWTPNFYIIFVGPPGIVTKSTTAKIGHRLLAEVPGIHFGPASITWQALIIALKEAQELVVLEGSDEDLLTTERTPMACITSVISELGTFLKPSDDDMVDVLVDLWDGQTGPAWERKTKTSGEASIENPWLNVLGCTTPGWMKRNFPEHLIHGGLTSRIIFIYADKKRRLVARPSREIKMKEFKARGEKLVEDLVIISQLKGEYDLDASADAWHKEWYEERLWKEKPLHMASDRFDGYRARKQTHVMKLAIVLAASQRNEPVINLEDIQTSERFITALEDDMAKVFESIGAADSSRYVAEILTYVRVYKKISSLELWRLCIATMDKKAYSDAVQAAIDANYIKIYNEAGIMYVVPVKEES